MKKIFLILLIFPFLAGCNKLPMNGKLDGMWQLMEIEHLATSEVEYPTKTYYSIQLHLIRLQQTHEDERMTIYTGHFNRDNDSLRIYNFRVYGDEEQLATEEQLLPYGIYNTDEHFKIEKLTSGKMILRSENVLLNFRKF